MGSLFDLTGQQFGRLTVIERAPDNPLSGHAEWLCRCECGETIIVRGWGLRSGRTVSCGCARRDPVVRAAARSRVPASRRRSIARAGAKARWAQ